MNLQLYFYNQEQDILPATIFEMIESDVTLERLIQKLTGIRYNNSTKKNRRAVGTELSVIYNNKEYPVEITKYVKDRRIEFTIILKDVLIKTMLNIVPVEMRSEIVVSSVLETKNPSQYLKGLLQKPLITKEFNNLMKHL